MGLSAAGTPDLEFQYWVTKDGQRCGIHHAVGECRGPPAFVAGMK